MVKNTLKAIWHVISSRLFLLGLLFISFSMILIMRVFQLQIIHGESYLNDYLYKAERTIDIPSTRGMIYDRNGVPLAYNELAHAVVIADDGSQNNRELNYTIYKAIQIIEKNGDSINNDFPITIDTDDNFIYATESDLRRLEFLRDAYGKQKIEELDTDKETLSMSTAEDVFLYLCSSRRYNILNELSVSNMTEEEREKIEGQKVYTIREALKILIVRYALSTTSYQRYVTVTMASDVNDITVAAIKENKAELPGISIEEETIRKYSDAVYFAHIIGYTGKPSTERLKELREINPAYSANDTVGRAGLEAYLETKLQGVKGSQKVYVDSQGTILDVAELIEPVAGDDIYLSIDAELQKKAYDMFENYLAGILIAKIVNRDVTIKPEMSASSRYISVKDVYYALFNNGILDINHLASEDATENEKLVYSIYENKMQTVLDKIHEELTSEKPLIYSALSEEYQVYMSYIYTLLAKNGVLAESKIDKSDKTYLAWRVEDVISLKEFLLYAISKNWIDTSKLNVETKYSDTQQIYSAIIEYIEKKLVKDTGFSKKLYRYMVNTYELQPTLICQLLFDQNVIVYNEKDYNSLRNGNSVTAYKFILDKIRNIEITPAQLALDPCSGSICLTDVNTGQMLVMVTYPSYDTNRLSGNMDAEYWSRLSNDETNAKPLYNRATMTGTAPGSTYKMITAIAGLEEGVITTSEQIRDLGLFDKIDPPSRCYIYPGGTHGLETVTTAIRDSCNYYFYETGYRLSLDQNNVYQEDLGINRLAKYAEMFGFNSRTGIELDEAAPHISTEYPVTSAIGQGNNNYTNVQMVRYVATLANRGINNELTLLYKRTDSDGILKEQYQSNASNIITLKDSTWAAVLEGMRQVVSDGSVRSIFRDLSVTAAGKTGTAQENPYRPNHAVFVAFAPYENPEVAVSVLIPNGYTSSYAAQIAKDMLKIYYTDEENEEENDTAIVPGNTEVRD